MNTECLLAVIIHYKRSDLTLACLRSLRRQGVELDCLVIDNGSCDGSADDLRHELSARERMAVVTEPQGFGEAVNMALQEGQGQGYDFVMVLACDTELEQGALRALLRYSGSHPGVGAVAPLQVKHSAPDTVFSAGGSLNRRAWTVDHIGFGQQRSDVVDVVHPDWIDFAAVLIRTSALAKVGVLATRYRFYWEDVDWSVRCASAGFRLAVVPSAVVRHHVSGTADVKKKEYFLVRNKLESALALRSTSFAAGLAFRHMIRQHRRTDVNAVVDFLLRRYRY